MQGNDKKIGNITIKIKSKGTDIHEKIGALVCTETADVKGDITFTVKSPVLDALKSRFASASKLIKKSIAEGRPLLIRHHSDTDGYAGAIALEKALMPRLEKQFGPRDKWFNFDRAPSTTPFYEYSDLLRDLTFAKKNIERFNKLEPLVILIDNGSTSEDLLSIRKAKIYRIPIIVIDHHFTEVKDNRSAVDSHVDIHINPYLVGGTKDITAGMLAYELARILNPDAEDLKILPALAGTGDRSKGPEFDAYLKNSKKDPGHLKKIAMCIDYEAHYLRFMQDSGLVYDLLSEGSNSASIDLLFKEITQKIELQKRSLLKYVKKETLKNSIILAQIDILKATQRGEFPGPGKSIGILIDSLKEKHPGKCLVCVGYGPDFVTIRSCEHAEKKGFNINMLVRHLAKEVPHGIVSGGGHEVAGSVKFIESAREEILEKLRCYIENL